MSLGSIKVMISPVVTELAAYVHDQVSLGWHGKVDVAIVENNNVRFSFEKTPLSYGFISFTCLIIDGDDKVIGKYTLEPIYSVSKDDIEKAIRYAIFDNKYKYDRLQVHTILSIDNDDTIDVYFGAIITPSDMKADVDKLSNKAMLRITRDMIDDKTIGNLIRATEEQFTSNDWTIVMKFGHISMVFESYLHTSPPPYVRTTECLIYIGSTDNRIAKVSFDDRIPLDSGKESTVYLSKLYGALARSAMDMAKDMYDFDVIDGCIRMNSEHGMKINPVFDDDKAEFLSTRFE